MKQILFIRHGATEGNRQKRYIGRTDEPLSPLGIAQAEALKGEGISADVIFVSPLRRAVETAELLFPGQVWQILPGLRETDFGIFEGKTAKEMENFAPYQDWVNSGCLAPIPGGESAEAFKERCCRAFEAALDDIPSHGRGAFVTHGGVIMAILERYARPKRDFYGYQVENGTSVPCTWQAGVLLTGGALC